MISYCAECHFADSHVLFIFMLSVVMLTLSIMTISKKGGICGTQHKCRESLSIYLCRLSVSLSELSIFTVGLSDYSALFTFWSGVMPVQSEAIFLVVCDPSMNEL